MLPQPTGRPDDPRTHIQGLLKKQAIQEAIVFTGKLQSQGTMDRELARWLLKEARSWHTAGFFAQQKQVCEWMLQYEPEHFEALHLLGFHAQTEGDFEQAEAYYRRALASNPEYAFSRLALAQLRMMRTKFREGRKEYEARFEAVTEANGPDWRGLPIPRWRGESLVGKRLYLWAEQGLGDMLMFAGFLPRLVADSPASIVLGMFPKLISLFARSFPGIEVEPIEHAAHVALAPVVVNAFPQIEKLAAFASVPFSLEPLRAAREYALKRGTFDYAAPLGDAMVCSMPEHRSAGCEGPYLSPDPARVAQMRSKLSALGPGRRVGISWRTQNMREATRNIPLKEWLPILSVPGCRFVSLQHQVSHGDVQAFCQQNNCALWSDPAFDFVQDTEALVALVSQMDEVITIDNSNVHLAGALGVQTTLLLPKGHNFRWPECEDEGTLWYKSVRTLRQQELSDWMPAIARAAESLLASS